MGERRHSCLSLTLLIVMTPFKMSFYLVVYSSRVPFPGISYLHTYAISSTRDHRNKQVVIRGSLSTGARMGLSTVVFLAFVLKNKWVDERRPSSSNTLLHSAFLLLTGLIWSPSKITCIFTIENWLEKHSEKMRSMDLTSETSLIRLTLFAI